MPIGLAFVDLKRYVLHRADHAAAGEEAGRQILDLEERRRLRSLAHLLQARIERVVEAVGDQRDAERHQADREPGKGRGPPGVAAGTAAPN